MMIRMLLVGLIGFLLPLCSAMGQTCGTGIPYTFASGATISAAQMNANFAYLATCYATLQGNTFTGAQILNADPTTTLGAATKHYVDASAGGGSAGAGFANRLRNGTFVSWPNGVSGTIATSPTGSAAIAANGWAVLPTGASVTWAQVTAGNNGTSQSLKVTGAASVSDVTIGQRIESFDAAALAGKAVTFQMAVYNSTGAAITPTLATRYAGATDNWTSPSPVADLAATPLSSCTNGIWTVVTYTFNASANAVNGYEIKVDFGNNFSTTGKYVQISAADLRATPGAATGINTPPAPELPNVQVELARNARYFDASYENGTPPGTATHVAMFRTVWNSGSTQGNGTVKFTVPMRAAPTTFSFWDGAGTASRFSYLGNTTTTWGDGYTGNPSPWNVSKNAIQLGGGATPGDYYIHYTAYADFW